MAPLARIGWDEVVTHARVRLRPFLAANPFPQRWTQGLFYREKMRAIHQVAPPTVHGPIADVGGGSSRLLAMLYPTAPVVSVDIDVANVTTTLAADARRLPFPAETFDLVSMFDVLEHIDDDAAAASEARRVLRPGGRLFVSTPSAHWRYPRAKMLIGRVRDEAELLEEWGHVRRGYAAADLDRLIGLTPEQTTTFGGVFVSPFHDIGFSGWSSRRRRIAFALSAPAVLAGYAIDTHLETGNELVRVYREPAKS